jgi:AcrR family transcriptional regulator
MATPRIVDHEERIDTALDDIETAKTRPPLTRRKQRGPSPLQRLRRKEIFDLAILLMREKGFVKTSVQDLTDRLDFSKANFYYYIKSKEEMLYRISVETLSVKLEKIKAILDHNVPHPERMLALIDCFVKLVVDHTAVISVYFEEKRHLTPQHLAVVNKLERQIFDLLSDFYREGVETGDFRDVDPTIAAFGILGTCFWLTKWYQPKGPLSASAISQQVNALLSEGYRQPVRR